jgi:hypothetical protein
MEPLMEVERDGDVLTLRCDIQGALGVTVGTAYEEDSLGNRLGTPLGPAEIHALVFCDAVRVQLNRSAGLQRVGVGRGRLGLNFGAWHKEAGASRPPSGNPVADHLLYTDGPDRDAVLANSDALEALLELVHADKNISVRGGRLLNQAKNSRSVGSFCTRAVALVHALAPLKS